MTQMSEAAGVRRLQVRIEELERALAKINAIRNSIIEHQNVNWSAHIYPLVAALNEAGYANRTSTQPLDSTDAGLLGAQPNANDGEPEYGCCHNLLDPHTESCRVRGTDGVFRPAWQENATDPKQHSVLCSAGHCVSWCGEAYSADVQGNSQTPENSAEAYSAGQDWHGKRGPECENGCTCGKDEIGLPDARFSPREEAE